MKKYFGFVCAWGVICSLSCGCADRKESEQVMELVKKEISHIRHEMAEGRSGLNIREGNPIKLARLIDAISNVNQKVELANMYATAIREIDLEKLSYRHREDATRYYFDHLVAVIRIMNEMGVLAEQCTEIFFECMSKFRSSCLTVPLSAKSDDETVEEFAWRCDCARKLYVEYDQRMSEIKRFWLPHLSEYLPIEVHDEFRRRINPFFEFPTEQEFRNAPMFRGSGLRKITPSVTIAPAMKRVE